MRQLVRRSRRAGWPIEGTLWRCPGQARRRACCVPLAVACGAAPLQPRKRRAQHQHAAHQAAECCTGVQRTLRRCGTASPPCPRSRRAAARPSTSCRRCALLKGSTGCSRSLRSFVQRNARATPHKADPQSGQEAVCGRPGSAYSPPPRPCPPPGRARSGDTTISGIVCPRRRTFFLLFLGFHGVAAGVGAAIKQRTRRDTHRREEVDEERHRAVSLSRTLLRAKSVVR